MRGALALPLLLLLGASAAVAARSGVFVLPRPAFPAPVQTVTPSGPVRLAVVSARVRDPQLGASTRPAAWMPKSFVGAPLLQVVRQPGVVFLIYGRDGSSARYLVGASPRTHRIRYAFDLASFARPPHIAPGASDLVTEQVLFAREAGGVVYVETAHQTYAQSSGGRNGYIAAIDIRKHETLWRSPALVANARTFVLAGNALVTGYGFTREDDWLYLIDRATGRVRDRLPVPSAPETITRRGNRLLVRTYDHDVVAILRPS